MEKYVADLSKSVNGQIVLVDIDSAGASTYEAKLGIFKMMQKHNKNIVFFDENKEMIGDVELNINEADAYLIEKHKMLLIKEAELEKREKELQEYTATKPLKNKRKA